MRSLETTRLALVRVITIAWTLVLTVRIADTTWLRRPGDFPALATQ